ncbi:MAG: hypothetical protein P1V34_14995 [Alphaproteobacteria bacterium]|nr:hypothetical protein [Alphaproteobacteria bacterium]
MDLVAALRSFNRKERYWLVRNIQGEKSQEIGCGFRKNLEEEIQRKFIGKEEFKIPCNAWWAMDYHLNWVVGALHLYKESLGIYKSGESKKTIQENSEYTLGAETKRIVQGNQQDTDLIIAYGSTLILIEAKCEASWDSVQLESKICRLDKIFEESGLSEKTLTVFFLLLSPEAPNKTKAIPYEKMTWNGWAKTDGNKEPWIKLDTHGEVKFNVSRCHDKGKVSAESTHWRIIDKQLPKQPSR